MYDPALLTARNKAAHKEIAVEPNSSDRQLLVNVLTTGSRNGAEVGGNYEMFDTYITYLCDRLFSTREDSSITLHSLISLFAIMVEYFTVTKRVRSTIGKFLDDRYQEIVKAFPEDDQEDWRRSRVKDTVNCIALWLMIEDFGNLFYNGRVREAFFEDNKKKLDTNLAENVEELEYNGKLTIPDFADIAGLKPKIAPWVTAPQSNPFEEIPKSNLNARLILRIGQIKLKWTFDISRHMKFEHSTLELFCMPSRLVFEPGSQVADTPDRALTQMGFHRSYVEEVKRSYLLLFGPQFRALFEDEFASPNFPQPKDPYLRTVCLRSPDHANLDKLESWLKSDFNYLWPRIRELEQHVRNIRPDSLWKLIYRDRRDSLAWYTFLFAIFVLILTLISTVFAGIQAIKSFSPSAVPAATEQKSAFAFPTGITSKTMSLAPTTIASLHSSDAVNITIATPHSLVAPALSYSAIAGIVIALVAAAVVVLSCIYIVRRRRKLRKPLAFAGTGDVRNIAKPSYAFPPTSDIDAPRREFTESSASTDLAVNDSVRAKYIMSPFSTGSDSVGHLPKSLTITANV